MKLMRVGERGAERPAVLDDYGVARDVSGVTGDFGPAFFADGALAQVAAALASGGLPEARPGWRPGGAAGQGGVHRAELLRSRRGDRRGGARAASGVHEGPCDGGWPV